MKFRYKEYRRDAITRRGRELGYSVSWWAFTRHATRREHEVVQWIVDGGSIKIQFVQVRQ